MQIQECSGENEDQSVFSEDVFNVDGNDLDNDKGDLDDDLNDEADNGRGGIP